MNSAYSSGNAFLNKFKKRAKFAGTARAEKGVRKAHLAAAVGNKAPKSRSEKSRLEWRNDPQRDEEICRYIQDNMRVKQPVRLSSKALDTVSVSKKKLAEAEVLKQRIIPDIFVPHWDHSSAYLKMIGWGLASHKLGAFPFTLRIAPSVFEAAQADSRGIARYFQDRINRLLKSRLRDQKPDFWFAIEKGFWDEPHIHGAVVIPHGRRDVIADGLRAAGGVWQAKSRQLLISERRDPIRWVGYSTKWLFSSAARLDAPSLIGASMGIRREAKASYQAARSEGLTLYPV